MAKQPIIGIKGLYTSPNPFSSDGLIDGACQILQDMVIDRGGMATPRGGAQAFSSNLGGSGTANSAKWFGGKLVIHGSDGILKFLQTPSTPTWQNIIASTSTLELGTLAGPSSSFPVRFCESGGNLYASTKWGVLRVQPLPGSGSYSYLGTRAGCPRATFAGVAINANIVSNVSGPVAADSAVAYRAVWCFKDSQGRIIRGQPSGRYVIKHTPLDIQPAGTSASAAEFVGNGTGSATATRASGSNTVILTFTSNRYKGPVYAVGDVITVAFSDNEASTSFKSGTYTITATTTAGAGLTATISYTVNTTTDPNPGTAQTATKLIKVRGPGKAASLGSVIAPSNITTNHFLQVYRSEITTSASITPSDEMRLCSEVQYSSGAAVTIPNDTVSALVLGETLYTSPSVGEGGNISLPRCKDLVEYQGCMFFLNTELLPQVKAQILTPTAGGATYEIAYNGSSMLFNLVPTNANPSAYGTSELVQQQAEGIAISLSGKNGNVAAPLFNAFPELVADDISTVGLMRIECQNFDALPFEFRTSFGSNTQPLTNPVLPGANTVVGALSFSDIRQNRIYFSKPQEPEHVAAANFIDVGSSNYPILRGVVVQNSLFVLKADGIFRITGDGYEWSVEPFDLTRKIIASESAQVVGNKAYFLASNGVVELDESGARMVSRNIDASLTADMEAGTPSLWHAAGTDLDHRYVLFKSPWGVNAFPLSCYVYNLLGPGWTTWKLPAGSASATDPSGYIYIPRNNTQGLSKLMRPTSGANIVDTGTSMLQQIQPLPFTGGDPSQLKHFGAVKVMFGPISGQPLQLRALFTSELSANYTLIQPVIQPSTAPQTVIIPVSREQSRCAQLSMFIQFNQSGAMFQVLGFEPVFQLAKNQKVGHR